MKVFIKNSRTLTLAKLLKRRRMSLTQFLQEQGITTYESLVARCKSLGVTPPTKGEYASTGPEVVSNPSEGVVVVEPIPVTGEKSGKELEEISPRPGMADLSGIEPEKPKRRRRCKKSDDEKVQLSEDNVGSEEAEEIPEPTSIEDIVELDRVLSGSVDNEQ